MEEEIHIEGRTFRFRRPAEPDRLLDHPATVRAFENDEYMPYWADLWPAARMLAKAILRHRWQLPRRALELGCGLGLPGIAGLAAGLDVTFSDYDAAALRFAAENAALNGFHSVRSLRMDWRQPPDIQFPLVFASDLMYEERNVEPVVRLLASTLTSDGECWLTDQDRKPASLLRQTLERNGFTFQTQMLRVTQDGRRIQGTLYRIHHHQTSSPTARISASALL